MTYDSRDRMLTKVPDASLGEPSHTYVYSPTGMRLSSTDGSGTTTYTYDLRDRMLTKAAAAGTLTYTYDADRQRRDDPLVEHERHFGRLRLGRREPARFSDRQPGGRARLTAAYTPTQRPATLTQPNGIGLTYSYDSLDRVTSMLWRQGTSPAFGSWAYMHNERGQRLTVDRHHRDGARRTATTMPRG